MYHVFYRRHVSHLRAGLLRQDVTIGGLLVQWYRVLKRFHWKMLLSV